MKTENNLTQDMKYIYFKEARFVLNKQSHIFFRNLFGKENYNKLSTWWNGMAYNTKLMDDAI